MSDRCISIIPTDPTHLPTQERTDALLTVVEEMMPVNDGVTVQSSDEIGFFDSGENFEPGRCPNCREEVPEDWWGEAMNESYESSQFADRTATPPCCSVAFDLNDLVYGDSPMAFGRYVVSCTNPATSFDAVGIGRLEPEQVDQIAAALGHPVTIVYQHI